MNDAVTVTATDGVLTVTLSRPEKANALSAEMAEGILDAMDEATRQGARVVVLRGAGRHFCAGFDFGDFDALSDGDLVHRFVRVEQMLQAVFHAAMPVVALVNGRAVGAGCDLAAAALRVIATPASRFQMPGPRFGVVLGTRRLAYRIGNVKARQIQIENRPVEAAEALALGLVDELVEQEAWDEALARAVAACTQLAPDVTSALAEVTRPDTRDADLAALARSVATPGIKARIAAFRATLAR